ncbi:MAG: glycosyltransferase [Verrucomicrobiota bacterium]
MHVTLVNNQLQLGGAETVVSQLHRGLRKAGHESFVRVAWGKSYPRGEGIEPLYPRRLSRLSHTRLHSLVEFFAPRAAWIDRAFRALGDGLADVIHVHNFHGDYASIEALADLANRKPVVWTFHAFWGITGGCDHPRECLRYQKACGQCPHLGEWPLDLVDRTEEQLRAKLERLAPAPLTIIAPSRHLAGKVRNSPVGQQWRVVEIPNGVDPDRFGFARKHDPEFRKLLKLNPAATVILVVNRDFRDPNKGFAMVAKALAGIDPANVQILLAGQASDWAAAQLPRFSCIDAGYVRSPERMAEWFEAADVFLFASAAENFPCVILEAMSSKCCIVSTPTSGVTEQIEHGSTGFLATEISGKSLGEALDEALSGDAGRLAIGENARRRVEQKFSETVMLTRHIDLYHDLRRTFH